MDLVDVNVGMTNKKKGDIMGNKKTLAEVNLSDLLCAAIVYKKDTLRYTGRGKSGFEMHYDKMRCKRRAIQGKYCWQHAYQRAL